MTDVLLVGAGQIGRKITWLLERTGDYRVTLTDRSQQALHRLGPGAATRLLAVDAEDTDRLTAALDGMFAVISAAPYNVTRHVADAARRAGVHYLDLTEDVAMKAYVKSIAEGANSAFIPQCGLAPGFISIVGYNLAQRFDSLDTLSLRVGALPQFPSNALTYNLTWSTDGVINEYCQPCEAIVNGQLATVPPMEEIEHFSLDGIRYEAFNTSGGLGTLCETLSGRVRQLNYRTIRYPGHRDAMKMLLQDLRLAERPELLKEILEYALPSTRQDVVVIFVTATGYQDGRLMQESYMNRVLARDVNGKTWTGIQTTTASAVCAVLDMLKHGQLPKAGFIRQEQISLPAFLSNRFGRVYAPETPMPGL
ncbi:MAG: saccharopine dehydrogenase family protein [Alphaproteobacteria bacterium]